MFENLEPFTSPNINHKIHSIPSTDLLKYDMQNLGSSMSKTLSSIFKTFTFCVDRKNKHVIIKTEDEEYKKMTIDEFITLGLNLGIESIQKMLKYIEEKYDEKFNDNDKKFNDYKEISDEEYLQYDEAIQKIKDFFRKKQVSVNDDDYPFENLSKQTLSNCEFVNLKIK
jgi:hypothetical protein